MIKKLDQENKPALLQLISNTEMFSIEEANHIEAIFSEQNSQALWFGAFEQGVMLGVAYCEPMEMTNKTWNILMLLVDPTQHRKGVGQGLMRKMEQTLTIKEQRLLMVETSSTDDFIGARHFYKNIGYAEQGHVHDYYDDGDHKVTFVKRLNLVDIS